MYKYLIVWKIMTGIVFMYTGAVLDTTIKYCTLGKVHPRCSAYFGKQVATNRMLLRVANK